MAEVILCLPKGELANVVEAEAPGSAFGSVFTFGVQGPLEFVPPPPALAIEGLFMEEPGSPGVLTEPGAGAFGVRTGVIWPEPGEGPPAPPPTLYWLMEPGGPMDLIPDRPIIPPTLFGFPCTIAE